MDQEGNNNSRQQHHQQSAPESSREIRPPPLLLPVEPSSLWHHETTLLNSLIASIGDETSTYQDFFNMLSNVELHSSEPPIPPPLPLPPPLGLMLPNIESVGGFEKGESSGTKRTSDVVQVSTQEVEREDEQQPSRTRRRRPSHVHNMSERTRRGRITEKIRTLRELVPNCYKTDKASVLTDAIEYIKFLLQQLQIKSAYQSMLVQYYSSVFPMRPMMGLGYGMNMCNSAYATGIPMAPFPHGLNDHFGESAGVFQYLSVYTTEIAATLNASTSMGPTTATPSTSVTSLSSTFSQGEISSAQSIQRIDTDIYQAQILSQFEGTRLEGFNSVAQTRQVLRQPSTYENSSSADQEIVHVNEEAQEFHDDSTEVRNKGETW